MTKILQSAFLLIDSIFNNYEELGFTREQFREVLKKKSLPNSPNAITRVKNYISENYGLVIDFKRNGPSVILNNESDPNAIDNIILHRQLLFRDTIQKVKNDFESTKDILSFSFDTKNKNSKYLPNLVSAILERKKISFEYKKFNDDKISHYKVNPLHIKEYLNRWYLIAKSDKSDHHVFSFDRIENLKISDSKFKRIKDIEIFKDTIGINFSGRKIKVRIWTDKEQYPYFESLPLHNSQKLEEKTDNGFIFSIEVTQNYELERWLLYYGNRIEILEPKDLRETIKQELTLALKKYT